MRFIINRNNKQYNFGDVNDKIIFDISTRVNEIDINHNILLNDDVEYIVKINNYNELYEYIKNNQINEYIIYHCSSDKYEKNIKMCNQHGILIIKRIDNKTITTIKKFIFEKICDDYSFFD